MNQSDSLRAYAARLRPFLHASGADPAAHGLTFEALALELFALQFGHNTAYRRVCEALGRGPGNVKSWEQIPAVPAAAFKELELTCLAPGESTAVFHSSGTTAGQPGRHFHSPDSLALYRESLWPWFRTHLLANGRTERRAGENCAPWRLASLVPHPRLAPHSSLAFMCGEVAERLASGDEAFFGAVLPDGSWSLDFDRLTACLEESSAGVAPVLMMGTAFQFVAWLDHCERLGLGFDLPPGSRVMETGGYKGRSRTLPKDELHAQLADALGIEAAAIVSEYGMSELGSQAYDGVACAGDARRFRFPPWARVQIVSPETGREVAEGGTGLVRVFDLANAWSVAAVQTEDLGVRRGEGFELLGRAALAEPRGCSLQTA
jgi:hypothetical protein